MLEGLRKMLSDNQNNGSFAIPKELFSPVHRFVESGALDKTLLLKDGTQLVGCVTLHRGNGDAETRVTVTTNGSLEVSSNVKELSFPTFNRSEVVDGVALNWGFYPEDTAWMENLAKLINIYLHNRDYIGYRIPLLCNVPEDREYVDLVVKVLSESEWIAAGGAILIQSCCGQATTPNLLIPLSTLYQDTLTRVEGIYQERRDVYLKAYGPAIGEQLLAMTDHTMKDLRKGVSKLTNLYEGI